MISDHFIGSYVAGFISLKLSDMFQTSSCSSSGGVMYK